LGNGSFADFLATISVNFIKSGARQNEGPILAILPIRPIGPNQSGSTVCCCCAVLAQMNQMMVNMNTTMSLTAIDKRLMMK
jgi:hypothetical protein